MSLEEAQNQAMMGMYIGIGVLVIFVIVMIIVVPRQIRKVRAKVNNAAQDMGNEMELKTGLKMNGNAFIGTYKGYEIRLEKGIGNNKAAVRDAQNSTVSSIFFDDDEDDDWDDLHGNTTVYPTLKVWLTSPASNFADVTLFQSSNFFLSTDEYRNNRINGRIPDDAKLDLDADDLHKRGKFYGDTAGAQKMLASPDLKRLMPSWIYPDLRAEGTQITLELNNSNIIPKWGYKKTAGTDYMIQALDICVATAEALK